MTTFVELYEAVKNTEDYKVEELTLEFTEAILLRMEDLDINQRELAKRLGTSEVYVSRLMRGRGNFTLRTLVKLAEALECNLLLPKLQPRSISGKGIVIPFAARPSMQKPFNSFATRGYGSSVVSLDSEVVTSDGTRETSFA